jgi:hypothetical protein
MKNIDNITNDFHTVWKVIGGIGDRLDKIEERLSLFEGKAGSSDLLNLLALEHVHKMVKEKLSEH